jgi:CRP-like cAMP-binding protein
MIQSRASNLQGNRILAALSNADFALLRPHLELVSMKFRQRLQSPNKQIRTVYFPESGIASVVVASGGERRQAEIALVGREGMTGLPIVLGADSSPHDTSMQIEGAGQCISAQKLRQVIDQSVTMLKLFLRYVFAVQSGYTALANARGSIEERLARWLLMACDRVDGDTMMLTQEFIALMLGVRRARSDHRAASI